MEILEIKENFEKNYKLEKALLQDFYQILAEYFSLNEIKNRLEENGFDGVYILDSDIFDDIYLSDHESTKNYLAFYHNETKSIFVRKNILDKHCNVLLHEMGHAYLNNRNNQYVNIDGVDYEIGCGLEEGAMTILMNTKNIRRLGPTDKYKYYHESIIFKQLDTLYRYTNLREYKNLLIYLLKKPEVFHLLIKNIYQDIFSEAKPSLIYRSAFAIINGTDIIDECENQQELIKNLKKLNTLFLCIADEAFRSGNKKINNFTFKSNLGLLYNEIILNAMFNTEETYKERMIQTLDNILFSIECEMEDNKKLILS